MFTLTHEQRQELSAPEPTALDPQTNVEYVLVRKTVYERIKNLLDDDVEAMYPLLADLDSEDWEPASNYNDKPSK